MTDHIKTFLAAQAGVSVASLNCDLDLFENEIWDSLMIVRFVHFAEEHYGRKLDLALLREDDLRTIGDIEKLLTQDKS